MSLSHVPRAGHSEIRSNTNTNTCWPELKQQHDVHVHTTEKKTYRSHDTASQPDDERVTAWRRSGAVHVKMGMRQQNATLIAWRTHPGDRDERHADKIAECTATQRPSLFDSIVRACVTRRVDGGLPGGDGAGNDTRTKRRPRRRLKAISKRQAAPSKSAASTTADAITSHTLRVSCVRLCALCSY